MSDSVTTIGYEAFYNCENLTNITIPNGVTKIDDNTFAGCESLTKIEIPDSVTKIGNYAFSGCESLTEITVPGNVTIIGDEAFVSCESLKSIELPDKLTRIGNFAFAYTAYYKKSSNWKDSVLYIDNYLIDAKSSLEGSYTINSETKCIADSVFLDCKKLTSINVAQENKYYSSENGVLFNKKKSSLIFYPQAKKESSYIIPNGVKNIVKYAFYECNKLKSITIPDSVISIRDFNFYNCRNLSSITLPNSIKHIGYCVFENTAYFNNSSTLENGVLYINNYLFSAKKSVKGIYKIKSGTVCIAANAFERCESLTGIVIPKSVKYIGDYAVGYDFVYAKSDDLIVYGAKGTAAETYARNNGFEFIDLSTHKHNYSTNVTSKATTSKTGKATYTCLICEYKTTKTTSKISSIKLSHDTFTYNGNVKQPTVTVKDSNGNTLKKGTDYTVKYSSGRKNVGKYTVTVTFKGKYSGTKKLTFKIKPRSTSISKLSAGTKKFTITWKKRTTQTSGYQLEYSTSSSMKNASKKTYTTTSKNTRTITGLKSAKKYYVRVRTYKNVKIDGKTYKYYSSWSSIKSVKTK